MDTERSAIVNIDGEEHKLILTAKATKEIAARYGGLENSDYKLMKPENFEMAIGEIVWLITLLANQSILIHNFKNPDSRRELLTEDMVELLTTPLDLVAYREAITKAMYKGAQRHIQSGENSGLSQKTHRSGRGAGVLYPAALLWHDLAALVNG